MFRDCAHILIKEDRKPKGDIFYFSYGCVVLWGFTDEEENAILGSLKEFERNSIPKAEMDEFTFGYGDNMRIEEDEIILQTKNTLTKLAISYGLAQSVKLTTFEETIQKTIDNTKYLPEDLATKGKIVLYEKRNHPGKWASCSSKETSSACILKSWIRQSFSGTIPELEPFYRRTSHYLDVAKSCEVLNKNWEWSMNCLRS